MLILNFTYPLRCLRVPPVEYHCSRSMITSSLVLVTNSRLKREYSHLQFKAVIDSFPKRKLFKKHTHYIHFNLTPRAYFKIILLQTHPQINNFLSKVTVYFLL
jgi:hypothetical protein